MKPKYRIVGRRLVEVEEPKPQGVDSKTRKHVRACDFASLLWNIVEDVTGFIAKDREDLTRDELKEIRRRVLEVIDKELEP